MHMLLCSCTGFATMPFCVCQIHDDFHFRLFAATHASADQLCHSGHAGGTGNTIDGAGGYRCAGPAGQPGGAGGRGRGWQHFHRAVLVFSFLRFTTGLVAQAAGQRSPDAVVLAGLRPMLAALLGGLGLLLLQQPLLWLALHLLAPPAEVAGLTQDYFSARIWSARLPCCPMPSLPGCWAGQVTPGHGESAECAAGRLAGIGTGLGVAGAGWATAIAEAVGSVLAWRVMLRQAPWPQWQQALSRVGGRAAWRQLFAANIDIMVRTLLLTVAFALMTRSGAQLGTLTLAANQLLLQAFMVCVSLLDGFAVAAEVHGAHAVRKAVRGCRWCGVVPGCRWGGAACWRWAWPCWGWFTCPG
jgi:MATE family multidrug resistance protein